ncbi:MAG: glycine cleavage system protein H [Chlamydia sp.]
MKKYTDTQDWIEEMEIDSGHGKSKKPCRIGLSSQFIKDLGPIVWIDLPVVGTSLVQGESVAAVIESTKAAVDILAPLSGIVSCVNSILSQENGMSYLNEDPEESGWLYEIEA